MRRSVIRHRALSIRTESNPYPALSAREKSAVSTSPRLLVIISALFLVFLLPRTEVSADTYVSGTISANTSWTLAKSPYIVTGDIYVNGSTLTIQAGVTVKFDQNTTLYIDSGVLKAVGTSAAPITFTSSETSPTPGYWNGVFFYNVDTNTLLQYVTMEYGGAYSGCNLYIYYSSPTIKNSTIRKSSGHGIYTYGGSPLIQSNTITENETAGIYGDNSPFTATTNTITNNGTNGIYDSSGSALSISGNSISGSGSYPARIPIKQTGNVNTYGTNGNNAVYVVGDTVSQSLTMKNTGIPYIVTSDISVTGSTLTIEAGVTIKFDQYTTLFVGDGGVLRAVGTSSAPITFTSSEANPTTGYWSGIHIYNADTSTLLQYATVEYGGANYGSNLYIYNSSPTIKNCTIRKSSGNGIYTISGSPIIQINTITQNGTAGIYGDYSPFTATTNTITNNGTNGIYDSTGSALSISGNSISGSGSYPVRMSIKQTGNVNTYGTNGNNAVYVVGETVSQNLTMKNTSIPYIVTAADIYVIGSTLTIEAGVTVKFDQYATLFIDGGVLRAVGTSSAPITFTSSEANPTTGYWSGIHIYNADTSTLLQYATVEYGGANYGCNIYIYSASPTIKNCTIRKSSGHGIFVNGSGANPSISYTLLTANVNGLYAAGYANPVISTSDIISNTDYGVYNEPYSPEVNAENNWWGHTSGPHHPTLNSTGQGNKVSDNVDFSPWRSVSSAQDVTPPADPVVTSPLATKNNPYTLAGTKEANSSIFVNNTQVIPVNSSTTWQYQVTLQEGPNSYSVSSRDSAGNPSNSVDVTVILDTNAPTMESSLPADNTWVQSLSSVIFDLIDSYSTINFSTTFSGANMKNSSGQAVAGSWTSSGSNKAVFTPSSALVDGAYTITLYPTDALGNKRTVTVAFTLDSVPPPRPTIDPIVAPVLSSAVAIIGTKSLDSAAIVVTIDCAGAAVYDAWYPDELTWSTAVYGLCEGSNKITAYAVDAANNHSSSAQMTFTVDTRPPADPVVNTPVSPTKQSSITLTGTKETGSYLFVNYVNTSAAYAGTSWSYVVNLDEGENYIVVYAQDEAGNPSQAVYLTVVRDTTAPEVSSSTPAADSSVTQTDIIDILLTDAHSSINLNSSLIGASVRNTATNAAVGGAWSVQQGHLIFTRNTAVALPDGVYMVTINPVDVLGNARTASFTFTLDTALPVVQSLTMDPASPHKAENVWFTVTFNENMMTSATSTVTFTRGLFFSTYVVAEGMWISSDTWQGSYAFKPDNGDGTYSVKITGAMDAAGNIMVDKSFQDAFVLDTVAPNPPELAGVVTPTNVPNQILIGTKPAGTAISINGIQMVPENANTTWSCDYPLGEGENTLSITAQDAAGNDSAPRTAVIVLDTTSPLFTINPYQNPSPVATQTLTGSKEPGSIVKLNGTQIFGTTDNSTTWSYTVRMGSGITHLVFTAADALGNTQTEILDILYDTSAPSPLLPNVLVADGAGNGTEVSLSWMDYTASEDVGYYAVYKSSTTFNNVAGMIPVGTVNSDSKTYKVTGLVKGTTYYFAVVPVDFAGNQTNTVYVASAIPVDTVAPEEVTDAAAQAGYTAAQGNFITILWTPSINSTGDLAGHIVRLDSGNGYDSGMPLGKTATTYTRTGLSDATWYKFKISVKDTAGYESDGVIIEAVTRLNNPSNLKTVPGTDKVTLSWTLVNSAYVKQYNIYRADGATARTEIGGMTRIGTASPTDSGYIDTSAVNDSTYQYAVTVENISGAERTSVQSVSATPRTDSTGPVIDTFSLVAGQVVSSPVTITASAHDADSTMGWMELSIDGTVVSTQEGESTSYVWNVIAVSDGNHVIKLKAIDSKENSTEVSRQVIVSLAQPAMPSITDHVVSQTTPTYMVTVSGTAPLFTTVILKVNGVVVSQTPASPNGEGVLGVFTFDSIALKEGDNVLSVKASHRGGESAYSPAYHVLVDTGAPPAPQNLAGQVQPGGLVRFSWTSPAGEMPTGYNLYTSSSSFSSKNDPGVTNTDASPVTYQYKEYNPGDDDLRYYAVTGIDGAGNESPISNVVSISSDRTAPAVTGIQYTVDNTQVSSVVGVGVVNVSIMVSEPLKEQPFFSLEPEDGSVIVVTMTKTNDTRYEGTFTITAQSPHGPTMYKFSGKDMLGNRGNAEGTGITIDVKGPEASITSPMTALRITTAPVAVSAVLSEASIGTPSLTLKAEGGTTLLVSSMTSTDNGVHWTGTMNISGMPDGKAEFILGNAADQLGNIGTEISSGRYILVYQDIVPAPGVPEGLAATSEKAGAVMLTWYPVSYEFSAVSGQQSAVTYNLYRRAEGETTPIKIQTGIGSALGNQQSTMTQDIPPADGIYYYSVTAVGLMGSEGPASAEVQASSDRTGPPAPVNVLLSLGSDGITATWDAVVDYPSEIGNPQSAMPLKGYHLYRSNGPFASTSDLSPIALVGSNIAVDTSPSKEYRFYAVVAVDSLGNESALSAVRDIDFPVSPVRELVLQWIDNGAPILTWLAPQDGTVAGYHIYRNRNRITQNPVLDLSYTETYAVVNTIYGVSVVDDLGNESPIKEATLPNLTLKLKDGTSLRRAVLETLSVILTSGQGAGLTIDSLDVKIGNAPVSSLQGPFTLGSNTTLQLEKTGATAANAVSPVTVYIQANWSPSPGVTINRGKTTSATVLGSSTSLEIFNDPIVRSTDAKVRLKINNIGTAQMEVVTSEAGGVTHKVKVNLKDQDGNLLSTGYLDQRIGASIVNSAEYAVARINSNETFMTDPILLPVPASAPNKVIVEAVVENTYYHYSRPDQVTAPGMKGSAEAYIQETAYRAVAAPDKTFYTMGQAVIISGSAISNEPSDNNRLVPNVPVKLGISVKGFDRFYTVTTDSQGRFSYTFSPGSNEAGDYNIWAVHPDITDRTVQAVFSLAGLSINPSAANVKMARNRTQDILVTLENYGGGTLSSITFETSSSAGVTAEVIAPSAPEGGFMLSAGDKMELTFRISTDSTAPDTGWATMTARTAQDVSVSLTANITIVSVIPVISTTPSYIDTGMVRGEQKTDSFTLMNVGEETLRNARIEGPSMSWMRLTRDKTIGDIAAGGSVSVGFMFSPPDTLAQGVYEDKIIIYSDNHMPYNCFIQVTVTSTAVGDILFDVLNELMQDVSGATITFQNQTVYELIYTVNTESDGTVMKYDIPEGRYLFNISAPNHKPTSGTFTISPGLTTMVSIALQVNLVDIQWSVTPVVIEDRYEITVSQTFATNVPVPVLVTEPPLVTLPVLEPGQVFNSEFTVTNNGLIAAENVIMNFPTSFSEYDLEILSTIPKTLAAQQKVVVLYRVTRKPTTTAMNLEAEEAATSYPYASLFTEITGYGGTCTMATVIGVSGTYEMCPNTANESTGSAGTGHTIVVQYECGDSGSAIVSLPIPNIGTVGGWTQSGGGGGGSGQGGGIGGAPITPLEDDCFSPPPPCSSQCCN